MHRSETFGRVSLRGFIGIWMAFCCFKQLDSHEVFQRINLLNDLNDVDYWPLE